MNDHPSKPVRNTRLRRVRELEFQMSRSEFAKKVNETGRADVACGPRLVADWEDGNVLCPRAVYQRILTQMTHGRSMTDLGFTLPAPPARAARSVQPLTGAHERREEPALADRRSFLLDGAAALLALPLTAGSAPGKIGAREVRAVTAAVTTLYDPDHGSAPLRQAASEALHTAYQWLQSGTYTHRTETKLRTATGSACARPAGGP
ncbi:hypothetical protein OHT52_30995 [Streptomyces sp. NBC_00247]|uniref:hypothetical protein n=1 Tax=Streptomyces sp. NBC_00247 TaxID=2975689 RepID=UPI002E286DE6|nr:hypothetical protein [Streptomyces sp. NBC_00247]